jgi:hypothetical protein
LEELFGVGDCRRVAEAKEVAAALCPRTPQS